VVNLGALWAGPLAANLLGLAGADIIDVESLSRPDPTRLSDPDFHALLHNGHNHQSVDFADPDRLRALLQDADIVIEASRARALESLGVDARSVQADGRARTWLRITGHRDPQPIAFGNDAAVAGGLIAWDEGLPVFAGGAIADPLTGLLGALAVAATHSTTHTTIIDLAMADVAAYCASAPSPDAQAADVDIAAPHVAHRRSSERSRWSTHPH
jgi:crotonobetainyl-CoA:carnitine CoA-transferase CaiB-like acyl-CoA transferase